LEFTGRTNGKLYKALAGEFTNLNGKIQKVEKSVNEFQRDVGKYPKGLDHVEGKINEIGGAIVAAFSVEQIIEFGAACIEEFNDAQKAASGLAFAVKNLAGETSAAFDELDQQAEKISADSKKFFDDSDIKRSQTALLQMKLSTEQVQAVIPAIVNIAAATGQSLETVADKVGKAVSEGSAKALGEYGLRFKDLGNIADNTNQFLKLSEKYTGALGNAMETAAGKAQLMDGQAKALQESIGSKLSPAWTELKLDVFEATDAVIGFFTSLADGEKGTAFPAFLHAINKYIKVQTAGLIDLSEIKNSLFSSAGADAITNAFEKYAGTISKTNKELAKQQAVSAYKKSLEVLTTELKKASTVTNAFGSDTAYQVAQMEGVGRALEKLRASFQETLKGIEGAGTTEQKNEGEKRIFNLKKLSTKELELRIEYANEANQEEIAKQDALQNIHNVYTTAAFTKLASEAQKELDLRKKAQDKAIKQQEDFERRLKTIRENIARAESKSRIDAETDSFKRELKQEDENYRLEVEQITEQEAQLNEIILKGKEKEVKEAKELLSKSQQEREDLLLLHNKRLVDIYSRQSAAINEELKKQHEEAAKKFNESIQHEEEIAEKKLKLSELNDEKKLLAEGEIDSKSLDLKIKHNQEELNLLKEHQKNLDHELKMGAITKEEYEEKSLDNSIAIAQKEIEIATATNAKKKAELAEYFAFANKTLDLISQEMEKESQKRQEAFDKEITDREKNIDLQRQRAAQGLSNNLEFEKQELAKAQLRREQEARKEEKREKTLAFLKLLAGYAEKDPQHALQKAFLDIALSTAISAAFYEGTEHVGDSLGTKGKFFAGKDAYMGVTKSGHAIRFDENERILSGEQNKLIGNLTNDQLANLAYSYNAGKLLPDHVMNLPDTRTLVKSVSDERRFEQAVAPLVDEVKRLQNIVANKKETTLKLDGLNNLITETVEDGMRTVVNHLKKRPRL